MSRLRLSLLAAALLAATPVAVGQSVPLTARFSFIVRPQSAALAGPGNQITYIPGQQLPINVYLVQTVPGGTGGSPTGNVLVDEAGLFTGGTRVTFGTPGVVSLAGPNSVANTNIIPNPIFNDAGFTKKATNNTTFAEFLAPADFLAVNGAQPDGANGNRVLLGSFILDTNIGGGTTTLTASVPSFTNANVSWTNGLSIPYGQTDPSVYNLVPVPEPAGLLAVAAGGVAFGRRFRRRVAVAG